MDAGWRAGLNVEMAQAELDEATGTGDLEQAGRATNRLLACAQTETEAAVATMKMMVLAVDVLAAVKAEAKDAGQP